MRRIRGLAYIQLRMLICTITLILRVNINMHTCHIRTTQALAWVRVALSRGLACHVASTWSRAKINPLFILFLIVLNDLNSKINLEKPGKTPKN